jgi:hypothetical protein
LPTWFDEFVDASGCSALYMQAANELGCAIQVKARIVAASER